MESERTWILTEPHHFLALPPWASYLISLCLIFLNWKMGIIRLLRGVNELIDIKCIKVPGITECYKSVPTITSESSDEETEFI